MGLHTRSGLCRDGGKSTQPVRNKRRAATKTRRDLDDNKQEQQRNLFVQEHEERKKMSENQNKGLTVCNFENDKK